MRKLIIITQQFPYEAGEETFLNAELEALINSHRFETEIVTYGEYKYANQPIFECEPHSTAIGHKRFVDYGTRAIGWFLSFCFGKTGIREICDIVKSKGSLLMLMHSIEYYMSAKRFVHEFSNNIDCRDAILYTYWYDYNTLGIMLNKKKLGYHRLVSRIHGYDLYNERHVDGRQPFRGTMEAGIDELFFIAQKGKDYYEANWGAADSKHFLNRIGVMDRAPRTVQADIQRDYYIVASCSSIIPLKRLELIIEGLSLVDNIHIKWVHFGDGDSREHIEELARRLLDKKDNIQYKFNGYQSVEDIIGYYTSNRVDVFITTSSTEGCPVSMQEAMMSSVPIVGTEVGEIPLMIEGNGILLSSNPTAEEVCRAITSVLSSSEYEKQQMKMKSRIIWDNDYNAAKNSQEFVDELIRLSKRRQPSIIDRFSMNM